MANKISTTEWKAKKQGEVKDLLTKLHNGVEEISSSEDWARCLKYQKSFHKYSFRNLLLITFQMPEATRVAGYKTWQKLGRQVRKGEKALSILAPVPRKFEAKDADGNTEEKTHMYFRAVKVFDISQTEGDDVPTNDVCKLLEGSDDEAAALFETLKAYAEAELGYTVSKVEEVHGRPTANGICYMDERRIEIANRPALQQAKTLAHEIGHAILHSGEHSYDKLHSSKQMEVEAESVAFCIMGAFGLDSSDYSFGYVAGWSGGEAKKVEQSGQRIQGAVGQVLGYLEDRVEITRLRAENEALCEAA